MAGMFDREQWDAVVFDVDGTLYEQRSLRRKMVFELLSHCALRPWRAGVLRRLQTFRTHREALGEEEATGVSRLQYERPAAELGVDPAVLEREVHEWIGRRPLPHISKCRVPGARRFFEFLRAGSVRVAALSDYPAAEKLAALGLTAELAISCGDPDIDRLKPHPAGLLAVVERLGVEPERCLMIGDRDDRDGACARRAGVPYLLRRPGGPATEGTFSSYLELLPQPPGAG